jgi:hypothetical protein
MDSQANYDRYKDMRGKPVTSAMPLEKDTLRRFAQAIMDADPDYFDEARATVSKFGGVVAPPLYPVHAFRRPAGTPDPLDAVKDNPDADATQGSMGVGYGLPDIEMPYRRLLNGGNEIEFFRALRVGEKVVAEPRYVDVTLKQGKSGAMLLVVIETRFSTDKGELLLINKQTLIWR